MGYVGRALEDETLIRDQVCMGKRERAYTQSNLAKYGEQMGM